MKDRSKGFTTKLVESPDSQIEVQSLEGTTGKLNLTIVACVPALAWITTRISAALKSISVMQLPGYGKSVINKARSALNLDSYLSAIESVNQSAKGPETVLYGYSHGGYFTAQYALRNPDSVRALILVEPALYTPHADLLERARLVQEGKSLDSMQNMLNFVGHQEDSSPSQVAAELLTHVNEESALAREYLIRAESPVTDEDLARLSMPVLLIAGTRSPVSGMVKRAFQAIPHASVCWIEGASHLDLEKPEFAGAIASAIGEFLQRIDKGSHSGGFTGWLSGLGATGSVAAELREEERELAA
jgi:pimeloyl-ACP methyl ester carboxylesterase